jgi:hypothetical protein
MANKIEIGDLVVNRQDYSKHIVLDIKLLPHRRPPSQLAGSKRKKFLLISTSGYQKWVIDTALRVEYYLASQNDPTTN